MPKSFKVISQVIRMRRHGGRYVGRNNVEYPIRDAAQYEKLVELEATGDVQLLCTPEERAEYESDLKQAGNPEAPAQEPKVEEPVESGDAKTTEEPEEDLEEDLEGDI